MHAAVQSSLAARPSHVAESVVYDFDAYRDPGLLADPAKRIAEMVQQVPPVF
jgi:hypothetical protein